MRTAETLFTTLCMTAQLVGCVPHDCDPPEAVEGDGMPIAPGITQLSLTFEPYLDPLTYDVSLEIRFHPHDYERPEGSLPIAVTLARDGFPVASQTAVQPHFVYGAIEECISPCSYDLEIGVDPTDPRTDLSVSAVGPDVGGFGSCPLEHQGTFVLAPR